MVTADGLFQRLALIRSVERDIRELNRAFLNWRSKPLTEADYIALRKRTNEWTPEDARRNAAIAIVDGRGRYSSLIEEQATQWRFYLSAH